MDASTASVADAPSALDTALHELTARIARLVSVGAGLHATALPTLRLSRIDNPTACTPALYEPRLCVVVQGRKIAFLGERSYHYDPLHYLVVSMTLPMLGQVIEASPEQPYLCLLLDIDPDQIGGLLLERDNGPANEDGLAAAYSGRVALPLLDAVLRLMRLLDTPDDLPILAPIVTREIFYRVLQGDLGGHLRALAVHDGPRQRVARAVTLLRRHYREPLRIQALAEAVHMSTSALHHGFKTVTAMSPLQYQKQLRLHEARRLMLRDGLEAAAAAHRVGYESPSQFSREYKRLFGAPPRTEVAQLRLGGR